MTHTPGPWEYDGKFRVGIPHEDGWTGFRTNPDDARLIAAAPELLAFVKHHADMDDTWAQELVAKAEGKP
jgi:hypothetical protein